MQNDVERHSTASSTAPATDAFRDMHRRDAGRSVRGQVLLGGNVRASICKKFKKDKMFLMYLIFHLLCIFFMTSVRDEW